MNSVLGVIKGASKEFWWRLLSYFLSVFVVVPNIALLIFLVYMAEYNFFSYDFFIDGIFAMKWFFITTVLFIAVTSVLIYSPVLLWFIRKKRGVSSKLLWIFFSLISAVFWWIAICSISTGSDAERVIFVLFICIFTCAHIVTLTCYPAKNQFISLAVLISVVVFSCFNYPTQVAQIASIGLKSFGVGGDVSISFMDAESSRKITGKLKLLTPENVYMQTSNSDDISVYSLSAISSYIVSVK
ncbi:TPA: hypothetical protein RQJ98_004230 [Vibrio vulnificus]|nr:hypothetical protein [Vibrio vulnificus]HDY7544628.1 hypothetical protein [Vibrio vulnificus]HDY7685610.1 hypothetical protein [Vibrio vulnificus]